MAGAVEHDLGDGAHSGRIVAGFVPRGGGEAIERAGLRERVGGAEAEGGRGGAGRVDGDGGVGGARGLGRIGEQRGGIGQRGREGEAHLRAGAGRGEQRQRGCQRCQKEERDDEAQHNRGRRLQARTGGPFGEGRRLVRVKAAVARQAGHRPRAASGWKWWRGCDHRPGRDRPRPNCGRGCGHSRQRLRGAG